jgi:hypothetical protein
LLQTIRHERIYEARSERPVKGYRMPFLSRLRRPGTRNAGAVALTVALAVFLAACGQQSYPESIFHQRTDVNRDVDYLFKILIYAGTAVFIFVEGIWSGR